MTLQLPSPDFSALTLPVADVDPSRLFRISRHNSGEPYFGKSGLNRFDDPRNALPDNKRYGTSYFGFTLECAFAETVLHDRVALRGAFALPESELDRWVVKFQGDLLQLANLTGTHLKRLGGEGALSTTMPYNLPQAWSLAVHSHPASVDGFVYMSRHQNDQQAVVLFDRAKAKLRAAPKKYTAFRDYPGTPGVLRSFGVQPY